MQARQQGIGRVSEASRQQTNRHVGWAQGSSLAWTQARTLCKRNFCFCSCLVAGSCGCTFDKTAGHHALAAARAPCSVLSPGMNMIDTHHQFVDVSGRYTLPFFRSVGLRSSVTWEMCGRFEYFCDPKAERARRFLPPAQPVDNAFGPAKLSLSRQCLSPKCCGKRALLLN